MISTNGHTQSITTLGAGDRIRLDRLPRGTMNAVTHGLSSDCPVIHGESEEEWRDYRNDILLDLTPFGPVETSLAERLASVMWRQRRIVRFEVAATAATRTAAEKAITLHGDFLGPSSDEIMATACLPTGRDLRKIERFEAHLDRCRRRALGELLELQRRRRVRLLPNELDA